VDRPARAGTCAVAAPRRHGDRRAGRWYSGRVDGTHLNLDNPPPDRIWPAQSRADLVLAVLAEKNSAAQAARAAGVSEAELSGWSSRFLRAGEAGLRSGGPPWRPAPHVDLAEQNRTLRARLCEAQGQAELWRRAAGGALGPSATLR